MLQNMKWDEGTNDWEILANIGVITTAILGVFFVPEIVGLGSLSGGLSGSLAVNGIPVIVVTSGGVQVASGVGIGVSACIALTLFVIDGCIRMKDNEKREEKERERDKRDKRMEERQKRMEKKMDKMIG